MLSLPIPYKHFSQGLARFNSATYPLKRLLHASSVWLCQFQRQLNACKPELKQYRSYSKQPYSSVVTSGRWHVRCRSMSKGDPCALRKKVSLCPVDVRPMTSQPKMQTRRRASFVFVAITPNAQVSIDNMDKPLCCSEAYDNRLPKIYVKLVKYMKQLFHMST